MDLTDTTIVTLLSKDLETYRLECGCQDQTMLQRIYYVYTKQIEDVHDIKLFIYE